jgi:hypothetical protein
MADTRKDKKSAAEKPIKGKKVVKTKEGKKKASESVQRQEMENSGDDLDEDDIAKLEQQDFSGLVKQVDSEYELGWWFIKPKWDEWALRYKLYNNQKRDKNAVGDNTLFTIFQTVLASLYEDDLSAEFVPRESGDEEIAENLSITAEYDHAEMEKDMLDYEWDFEAMFHGRGLCCLMEFDRDRMVPVPEIWHAMTVIRDPHATSVNGDKKRKGAARFLYREVRLSKGEMEEAGTYFNLDKLKSGGVSKDSLIDENIRIMAEAAGLSDVSKFSGLKGENVTHRLLEGFTIYNGKRVFVTLANDRKTVVRYVEFEDTLNIPILDRTIYPVPNSWDSVSVPDLVEDKQRAKAVLTNLGLKSVKTSIHPMYLFDQTRVKNRSDLNFEFNKFIPVNGNPNGAVVPMQKDRVSSDVDYIMNTLDQGAQLSTASPTLKQGGQASQNNTATRDALLSQGSDTRYSLAARIFGWSEKRFWKQWYRLYKDHFTDGIDEKSVRITGALGAKWRPFTRKNLVASTDPDVKIDSRVLAEQRKFNELQQFRGYIQAIAVDPNARIRFALRYMGKLSGMSKDLIDQLLPPTIDEMQAEEENEMLRNSKKVEVGVDDDHQTHIEIHNKMEDTPEKIAHINAHKRAMLLQKQRPELFPNQPTQPSAPIDREGAQEVEALPEPVSRSGRSLPVQT